jgi:hypothetical protein
MVEVSVKVKTAMSLKYQYFQYETQSFKSNRENNSN